MSQDEDYSPSADGISLLSLSNHWLSVTLMLMSLWEGTSLEVQDRGLQILVPRIFFIFYIKLFMAQNVSTSFGA